MPGGALFYHVVYGLWCMVYHINLIVSGCRCFGASAVGGFSVVRCMAQLAQFLGHLSCIGGAYIRGHVRLSVPALGRGGLANPTQLTFPDCSRSKLPGQGAELLRRGRTRWQFALWSGRTSAGWAPVRVMSGVIVLDTFACQEILCLMVARQPF